MQNKLTLQDKIFITGSNGMAGRAIARQLKKYGYGDQNSGGKLLMPSRKDLDLLNLENLNKWFKKNSPTIVVHAAAKVGGILANSSQPADFLLENIKMQTNVIETAYRAGVKRFIFLGSSCIYPKYAEQPIKEEYLLKGSLEKTNESYAIAKIAGIKLCQALRDQYEFDAISLMPTNLYGPNDNYHPTDSHVLASLIRKFHEAKKTRAKEVICWGTGKPLREFMHVDDLGDAVVFALEKWDPKAKNAPLDSNGMPLTHLNVGTGKDVSIKELANMIAAKVGFKGNIIWDKDKPDGTPRKKLDVNKFKELGWASKIELDQGLTSTIETYKSLINN